MSTPSLTFRLGPHTYTALLPAPSLALLPQPTTTQTLTLSGGALQLPGGSVSLATNGLVPMSSVPESAVGYKTTVLVVAVATATVGTRTVTAIVTGFPTKGASAVSGGGSWVVGGQTLVTSLSEGLVVGGERTVGWGTTTLTRAVPIETTKKPGAAGDGGSVSGSRYQMGTRVFSADERGGLGGEVVESTVTSVSGERPTALASGEEDEVEGGQRGSGSMAMTMTATVTETERETTTVMVTAIPTTMGPARGRGGRVDVRRKVMGLGVLVSVLVGVVCW
ncbi:unnamed protein product [Zymoseptoria tritici ST99CH_1E4]|uniref:Uncharacterized protein n=1 Tax=Zymoseptoria tritici ST99CH_1E4 TaxID=1276532 RepID=A0A2H1GU42_ZYMTR|nr:unnamed protein product [Zymoseptoria tritici ST99CH_1E4]